MSMGGGFVHVTVGACGIQKGALELLELVLQLVRRCPVGILVSQN